LVTTAAAVPPARAATKVEDQVPDGHNDAAGRARIGDRVIPEDDAGHDQGPGLG